MIDNNLEAQLSQLQTSAEEIHISGLAYFPAAENVTRTLRREGGSPLLLRPPRQAPGSAAGTAAGRSPAGSAAKPPRGYCSPTAAVFSPPKTSQKLRDILAAVPVDDEDEGDDGSGSGSGGAGDENAGSSHMASSKQACVRSPGLSTATRANAGSTVDSSVSGVKRPRPSPSRTAGTGVGDAAMDAPVAMAGSLSSARHKGDAAAAGAHPESPPQRVCRRGEREDEDEMMMSGSVAKGSRTSMAAAASHGGGQTRGQAASPPAEAAATATARPLAAAPAVVADCAVDMDGIFAGLTEADVFGNDSWRSDTAPAVPKQASPLAATAALMAASLGTSCAGTASSSSSASSRAAVVAEVLSPAARTIRSATGTQGAHGLFAPAAAAGGPTTPAAGAAAAVPPVATSMPAAPQAATTVQAWKAARSLCRDVFGYESLRPAQQRAVVAAINGKDVMLVSPTGSGKSAAFMLPALVQPGLTVVILPLLALVVDAGAR